MGEANATFDVFRSLVVVFDKIINSVFLKEDQVFIPTEELFALDIIATYGLLSITKGLRVSIDVIEKFPEIVID